MATYLRRNCVAKFLLCMVLLLFLGKVLNFTAGKEEVFAKPSSEEVQEAYQQDPLQLDQLPPHNPSRRLDKKRMVLFGKKKVPQSKMNPPQNKTNLPQISMKQAPHNKLISKQQGLLDPPSHTGETEPMVLSLNYWEQIANAMRNLYVLQSWANSVSINKVLEPTIRPVARASSVFYFWPHEDFFQLGDLYDLEHWNQMSLRDGFSEVVSLNHFLEHATRSMVYVQIVYGREDHISKCKTSAELNLSGEGWYKFLSERGFHIDRRVCIDFRRKLPTKDVSTYFRRMIFNDSAPNMTVIFSQWRGCDHSLYRVPLNNAECNAGVHARNIYSSNQPLSISFPSPNSTSSFAPSQLLTEYTNKFLNLYLSNEKYIIIALRTQKIEPNHFSGKSQCAFNIISDCKKMARDYGITRTLFFSDNGRTGSLGWESSSASAFSQHIQDSLDLEFTQSKANAIIQEITGSKDPVLVALVQQQLMARATCVMAVGGTSFYQQHAINMYANSHKNNPCYVFRGRDCIRKYLTQVEGI